MTSAYDQIYRPLEPGDGRLVHLAPGKHDDPIICFLEPFHTRDPPPYVALSYVWGDPKITAPISVDGHVLQVTTNLEAALRHLRRHKKSRTLWIDAIAINQSDVEERSQQVTLMADIYRNAKSVTIWLGPADAYSAIIFRYMNKISWGARGLPNRLRSLKAAWGVRAILLALGKKNMEQRSLCGSLRMYQARVLFLHPSISLLGDGFLLAALAALHLVQMEWFSRRWCVQEYFLASSVTVQCGADSAPWETFTEYLTGGRMRLGTIRRWMSEESRKLESKVHMVVDKFASPILVDRWTPPNLPELLYCFRDWLNGNPKDTVYGLLALVEPQEPQFTVDYTRSDAEVLVEVVDYTLRYEQDLNLIGVPWAPNITGLPSWIVVAGSDSCCKNEIAFSSRWGWGENELYFSSPTNIGFLTVPWKTNATIVRQHETSQTSPTFTTYTMLVDGLTLETYNKPAKLPSEKTLQMIIQCRRPFNASQFRVFTKEVRDQLAPTRRPGDRVVVLFGCNHILLLRPVKAQFVVVEAWLGHFWDFFHDIEYVYGLGNHQNPYQKAENILRHEIRDLLKDIPTETFTIA